MERDQARAAASSDLFFYKLLAGLLSAGVIIGLVFGLGDVWEGPGWFLLEDAIVTLFVMTIFMWLAFLIFLLRVRVFFDIEDRAQDVIAREGRKLEEAMARQEASWTQLKDGIKQDLLDFRAQVRRDVAERDGRISEALTIAGDARRIALEAEQGRQVVQRSQNEMAPAIQVLQQEVVALQKELKSCNIRVSEALEAVERREMEGTAARQKLEHELLNLRKREQLLMIKAKELDEVSTNALAGRPTFVEN